MNLSHKEMNFSSKVYRKTSLARKWVRANVGTENIGLHGGVTVDTATVNLLAHPENTVIKTAKAVEKGSLISYSIGEGAVKATVTGVDKDLGIDGTIKAIENSRKDVLTIVAIAENKNLRENIDGALKKDAATFEKTANDVSEIVQKSGGVKDGDISHVTLYQGEQTENKTNEYAACYDKDNNKTYLNTEGTDISKGGDIIKSLFWEAQRKDNNDNDIGLNDKQQLALASSRGDQAENLWNRFSDTASTTSNYGGIVNWNNANAGSDTLMNGSAKANKLDTGEGSAVVPRISDDKDLLNHDLYVYEKTVIDTDGTFNSSAEAVDYIFTKKQLGLPITEDDTKLLAQSLAQEKNGSLSKEIQGFIKENPDEFKDLKISDLKVNDNKSVKAFANTLVGGTCFLNGEYENVVLSTPTSDLSDLPASYSEMYLRAYQNKLIQPGMINTLSGDVNDLENIQHVANTIAGGDKFRVAGATTYGGELTTNDVYNLIPTILAEPGTTVSGGRISGHSTMLWTENGETVVQGTGQEGTGKDYTEKYKPYNTQSIYILTPTSN